MEGKVVKGVLLTAYGSPASMEDVETYFTHIRGGKRPSPSQLEDLVARYRIIGGPSPLLRITESQKDGLQRALGAGGSRTKVFAGMKHSHPFIEEVVRQASSQGVDELLVLALAPHYSRISIGGYTKAVQEAREAAGAKLEVKFVNSWHALPEMVQMWADLIGEVPESSGESALVFSAHSLPEKILAEGDPYKDELLQTSKAVGDILARHDWSFAFQSASKTGEPWLGPDILEHLDSLYKSGERAFVIAPIGFVSDHLEVLYDIDVECVEWAKAKGVKLARCRMPNDSDQLVQCLLRLVIENGFM